ncbi:MAG: phage tail protein I [Phascolarctobacterium sp.]
MLKLENQALKQTLPISIASDKTVQDICDAIAVKLLDINNKTALLLLLPRLEQLSEALVDELAWQYHVDFYDYKASVDKKRALVRQAIAHHRYKGTPAAVEEVCTAVFQSAQVKEWFEYGGNPYHFQVVLIEEPVPDETVIDNLTRAIKATKNTRSWLDGMSFYRKIIGSQYASMGTSAHKSVDIYPSAFKMPDAVEMRYASIGIKQERTVEIKCQIGVE